MQEIYYTNSDDSARFLMGRFRANPMIVMGLNPSRATLEKFDMTITRVHRFSQQLGYDGWIMSNLYPLRCTHPDLLPEERSEILCQQNLEYMAELFTSVEQPVIWAAWGNPVCLRPYFFDCLAEIVTMLEPFEVGWKHLHIPTKAGHPRHPSRLAYQVSSYHMDIENYLVNSGVHPKK